MQNRREKTMRFNIVSIKCFSQSQPNLKMFSCNLIREDEREDYLASIDKNLNAAKKENVIPWDTKTEVKIDIGFMIFNPELDPAVVFLGIN